MGDRVVNATKVGHVGRDLQCQWGSGASCQRAFGQRHEGNEGRSGVHTWGGGWGTGLKNKAQKPEFAGRVEGMTSTSVAGGQSAGKEGLRFCVSNRSSGRMNELLSIYVNYGEKN